MDAERIERIAECTENSLWKCMLGLRTPLYCDPKKLDADPLERCGRFVAAFADDGRWVTIGAVDHHGGTPVHLDGAGKIDKGPAHTVGKAPHELGKAAEKSPEKQKIASTGVDKGEGGGVESPVSGGTKPQEKEMDATTGPTVHEEPGYKVEYRDGKLHITVGKRAEVLPVPIGVGYGDAMPWQRDALRKAGKNPSDFVHIHGTLHVLRKSALHVLQHAVRAETAKAEAAAAAKAETLRRNVPGIEELEAARNAEARYDRAFGRMMDDEDNDGARPPAAPKGPSAREMAAKYPRAALYLKAEGYWLGSHDARVAAGERAMKLLAEGGSEEEARKVLDNWLPASAYDN